MSLKILHIIPSLSKGGAERLVLTICNELQKRSGIEVQLITFSPLNEYGDLVTNITWEIIPSKYIPSISGKAICDVEKLQAYVNEYAPDLIHTHLWEAEIVSRQISSNAKWVSHMHDNMAQIHRICVPLSKIEITNWYERFIMMRKYKANTNRFIAISHDTFLYAKQNLSKSLKKNVIKLFNAIDVSYFTKPQNWIPKKKDVLQLVTVGSLVDKKNQIFLVSVISFLKKKGVECELHILGEGINKGKIQAEITKQNLNDSIFLHGNVSVNEYYWNSDIYIHSATYEPFGLVFLEAMAAGLPVVCLDGKGNRDLIENNINGCMITNQNPELFAEKIIEIWNNKLLYQSMSNNAIQFAKQFDIVPYVDSLLEIYKI
jgi:glycosyltransferase involved in cell wall biosynthesis